MNVSILGCGVFGLALAKTFLDNEENKVMVWSKFDKEVDEFSEKCLSITFTTNLDLAINKADLIVIAIPIAFLDETMKEVKKYYNNQDIVIASKGIDTDTKMFAYEIINKHLNNKNIGVISGGTFANDMSNKKVMGITLGTNSISIENKIKKSLTSKFLNVQYINDYIGVSICGAIKNVMAIGFGMLDGANFPPSSKFLFLTEAIYEIKSLITTLGGNADTVMSYAGIDDIMMTCTSAESRNYTLGNMIGKNVSKDELNTYKENTTIEGLGTSMAIYELANEKNINLPISNTIYNILYKDDNINELISVLEKKES